MTEANKKYRFETLQLHVGQEQADPATDSRAVPIYATTSYVFHNFDHAEARFGLADPGNIYGRLTNSTQGVFEDRIAALEGGTAGIAVASGAAAVEYAVRNITQSGDHIVSSKNIYGGTYSLFNEYFAERGLEFDSVDTADYEALDAAISGRDRGGRAASAVYFETLTNPLLQINNVNRISAIAHRYGALSIVDNTFVTPYLQQPLDLGADIVIHSATKYLAGHSEVNAGLVVVLDDEVGNGIYFAQNRFGGVLAPTECNDVRRGIQTLALRMECQQRNAQAVTEYLLAHPLVRAVHYPGVYGDRNRLLAENGLKGFGGVLSFEVVPGVDPSIVLDNLHVFHLAVSLGAVESLAELPCRMTHFELPREERLKVGITDELVRLSVGIEDVSDLIEDLGQGFDKAFEALDIDGVSGQVLDRLTTEVAA